MQRRNLPNRKSIRLKGWDYRNPGLYFITICTGNSRCHFGEIRDAIMGLSVPGCLANYYWNEITKQFTSVDLDEYVVMPNHMHGIIAITGVPNNDENQGTDTINRVPEEQSSAEKKQVGSPIHRDPNNTKNGGVTRQHNPMLYEEHLGRILRWYKGRCTFEIRERGHAGFAWHSRYYDHIIRNEEALQRIREYIFDNPLRWRIDRENPDGIHEQAVEYMIRS